MLNKDYYILFSMLETTEKILRYTYGYQSTEELSQKDRDFDATMMNFIVIGEFFTQYHCSSLFRN